MKITQKIEASTSVLVRMDEAGKVSARMVGHMPYAMEKETAKEGEGHVPVVSADVVFSDEDHAEIGAILTKIAGKHTEALAVKLGDARAEARRTAKFMGELI
jgi:hypothetical protein